VTQKYVSWQHLEAKDNGAYRYEILEAYTPDNTKIYKGFVVFKNGGDYWLENDNRDSLRMALITLGQQRA
jgi:hypothetical protein